MQVPGRAVQHGSTASPLPSPALLDCSPGGVGGEPLVLTVRVKPQEGEPLQGAKLVVKVGRNNDNDNNLMYYYYYYFYYRGPSWLWGWVDSTSEFWVE